MDKRKHWIIYSSLFVGLIGGFLWYHFRYVPSQKRELAGRLLRVLATTGDDIREELLSVVAPLTNTLGSAIDQLKPPATMPTNWVENLAGRAQRLRHVESVLEITGSTNATIKPTIEFKVRGEVEPPAWEIRASHPIGGSNVMVHIRLAIDALIAPMLRKDFEHFLILDKQKVVYQHGGGSDLRLSQFDSSSDSGTFQTNWAAGSGAEFVVVGQPFRLTFPLSETAHEMKLCGLVRAGRFERRSSEISFSVMIALCSGVLLLILCWPFLDARVAPLEGLRAFDLFSLVFSMLLGVWIITFTFLLFVSYTQLQRRLDQDLRFIAESINRNFRKELIQAGGELRRLDETIRTSRLATNMAHIYTNANIFPDASIAGPGSYPFFQMVFWADVHGQQVAKWTRKGATTRFIDVSSRDYFQRVIHDETWRITTNTLAIESIYSRNTGENMAVVAMPSKCHALAALDVNFLSLNDVLLPADFGFCIFDPDGKVLFHSDKSRNLRENFFAECNHHARLQAVVRGRSADRFDVTYSGQEHSIYLMPIQHLPWTLAVFRSERVPQIGNLVASSIALAYGLAGVAVGMCAYFFATCAWRWIWRGVGTPARYCLATLMNLALALAAVGWARHGCSSGIAPFALVFAPLLAAVANWAVLRGLPEKHYSERARRWLHTLAFGSMVFFVAGAPAIVSFVCVFRSEIELLARRNQMHLARAEAERGDRVRALYGEIAGGTNVAKAHATNEWAVYYGSPSAFRTRLDAYGEPSTGVNCLSLVFCFPGVRSLYSQLENDSLSYVSSGAHDGAWEWRRPSLDVLQLELEKLGRAKSPGIKHLIITSNLPRYPENGWWLVAAFMIGLVPSILCVWFVRRFMIERPSAPSRAALAERTSQSRWYFMRGPLVFVVLLAGLYYFTTQRPLWENSLTLLTGFAAAFTALVNVIKLLSDKTRDSQAATSPDATNKP